MKRPGTARLDSIFHVISHTPLICSTRSWPNSGAFYSNFRLHPIQFHLLFRTPSPRRRCCCCFALSCLYDKWNERFRSRSQLLRVVDIKDCQEEFPFYYRAKAAAKFKSFAKQNFDVVFWASTPRRLQLGWNFGKSQTEAGSVEKFLYCSGPVD